LSRNFRRISEFNSNATRTSNLDSNDRKTRQCGLQPPFSVSDPHNFRRLRLLTHSRVLQPRAHSASDGRVFRTSRLRHGRMQLSDVITHRQCDGRVVSVDLTPLSHCRHHRRLFVLCPAAANWCPDGRILTTVLLVLLSLVVSLAVPVPGQYKQLDMINSHMHADSE